MDGLDSRFDRRDLDIWFTRTQPVRIDGDSLYLFVGNKYHAGWITENYLSDLNEIARDVFGRPIHVRLTVDDDPTAEVAKPSAPAKGHGARTGAPELPLEFPERQRHGDGPTENIGLNTTQTFANFVIGECNRFAHAAAWGAAEKPATMYNPLFIYGDTGLGKTHLMHAIGNAIHAQNPSARVVYVTAEDFTNEMINSIRTGRQEAFREKYRRLANVLLVDDVQFLSGKERTQIEFFHTFNALQVSGRQIVLASDVTPDKISKLEPRLRSRFEGGLLADVQPPDAETLLAILGKKAEEAGFYLQPEVARAIASSGKTSIRELEGDVTRLAAYRRVYDEPMTIDFVRRHMPELFAPEASNVSVSGIIEVVAKFHSLRSADITGTRRTRALTRPRHIAMYLARHHTPHSFPELGREFGGRDHSTIQHGCRKIEKELEENADLAHQIRLLEQSLNIRPRT